MPNTYVLPDDFVEKFPQIRAQYQARTKIDLRTAAGPFRLTTFFGAVDTPTRQAQVNFLETLYAQVARYLRPGLEFQDQKEQDNHITALRILVAGCLYIKTQIDASYTYPRDSSSSDLGQIINDMLQIRSDNALDTETLKACMATAQQFMYQQNVFYPDASFAAHELPKMADTQRILFHQFLDAKCRELNAVYSSYPCRDFMTPAMSTLMKLAGGSVGYVLGKAAGRTAPLLSVHSGFVTLAGSSLLMMVGPSAQMGIMVLVPTIAGKILDTFCGLSLAYVLGTAMGVVGSGIGWGMGMSMDLSISLLKNACKAVSSLYYGSGKYSHITGLTLVDTCRVVDGVSLEDPIELQPFPVVMEQRESGFELSIGQDRQFIPWDAHLQQMPFMDDLRARIQQLDTSGLTPKVEWADSDVASDDEAKTGLLLGSL